MTTAAPLGPSTSDVPPAGAPQLRRSGTDRMAGGVCGGLADYTGIDAVLWRVAFVALTDGVVRWVGAAVMALLAGQSFELIALARAEISSTE